MSESERRRQFESAPAGRWTTDWMASFLFLSARSLVAFKYFMSKQRFLFFFAVFDSFHSWIISPSMLVNMTTIFFVLSIVIVTLQLTAAPTWLKCIWMLSPKLLYSLWRRIFFFLFLLENNTLFVLSARSPQHGRALMQLLRVHLKRKKLDWRTSPRLARPHSRRWMPLHNGP